MLLGALALLAWRLAAAGRERPALRRGAAALAAIGAWQLASGLSNVVLGWPVVAALAHTAGAAALVVVLATLLARTRAPAAQGSAARLALRTAS